MNKKRFVRCKPFVKDGTGYRYGEIMLLAIEAVKSVNKDGTAVFDYNGNEYRCVEENPKPWDGHISRSIVEV